MPRQLKKILSDCGFVLVLIALLAGAFEIGRDRARRVYSEESAIQEQLPSQKPARKSIFDMMPGVTRLGEPVDLSNVPGALQRAPVMDVGIDIERSSPKVASDDFGVLATESPTSTFIATPDLAAVPDLTWRPGESVKSVCLAIFSGVSRLCARTEVGISVDGSEDLVYEASSSKPLVVGMALFVDVPQGNCRNVQACLGILASDLQSCTKFLEDLNWTAWQLGIHAAYNNAIPFLEEYPQAWIVPNFYDGEGSNLLLDIAKDCSVTANQL